MSSEKLRSIGGKIYRLSSTFDCSRDAVLHARILKKTCCVVISRSEDGKWIVYWRRRNADSVQEVALVNL
jgi:hypothetical protein